VVGPFIAFVKTWGWVGLLMLLFISLYRLPEFVMGPMATPFYHDLGISKDMVGAVRGTVGLTASFLGIAAGGLMVARAGYIRGLILGGILQALAIASFAILAVHGGDPRLFAAVMFFDNFGVSAAGVALVTYMSSLTSLGYTATQYALLSSAYAMVGKFLKGFSGAVVDGLQAQGHTLMESYAYFFVGAGAIGLPAILLCLWLSAVAGRRGADLAAKPAP
jgi:PAT family beta-lactamase induction signal transducer AmpG